MAIKDFPNIGNNIQYLISGQQTSIDPQGSFIILLQLRERKWENVWIGRKIWPLKK